jgi:uncharacterized membrane protein
MDTSNKLKPLGPTGRCALTGAIAPIGHLVSLATIHPALVGRILRDHPQLPRDSHILRTEVDRFRTQHIEELLAAERGEINELRRRVAESIARRETISADTEAEFAQARTVGERLSDGLAKLGGSWTFLIQFALFLVAWMGFNVISGDQGAFDPYPFILLNLVLSCLAAVQAPIIMMSQRRQEAKDRLRSLNDYRVNLKAELEIQHLHEKIDHLLSKQWERLAEIQELQIEVMREARA